MYWQNVERLRADFETYRDVTDPIVVKAKVEEAQNWLVKNAHPEPYINPYQRGGVMFQRNAPSDVLTAYGFREPLIHEPHVFTEEVEHASFEGHEVDVLPSGKPAASH